MIGSSGTPGQPQSEPLPTLHVLSQDELERAQKHYADILSTMFGQASAFTNIISAAGYAGAFALWSFIRPELNPVAANWIAVLLGISLTTFVGWNVFNMLWIVKERWAYGGQMQGLTGDAAIKRWGELVKQTERNTHRFYLRPWGIVVVVTVTTAMLALGALIVNCAINLLELSV
jgi:hypothetical protein